MFEKKQRSKWFKYKVIAAIIFIIFFIIMLNMLNPIWWQGIKISAGLQDSLIITDGAAAEAPEVTEGEVITEKTSSAGLILVIIFIAVIVSAGFILIKYRKKVNILTGEFKRQEIIDKVKEFCWFDQGLAASPPHLKIKTYKDLWNIGYVPYTWENPVTGKIEKRAVVQLARIKQAHRFMQPKYINRRYVIAYDVLRTDPDREITTLQSKNLDEIFEWLKEYRPSAKLKPKKEEAPKNVIQVGVPESYEDIMD